MTKEDGGFLEEEERTKTLLSKAEISILLDNYDDIFSDFDPRPFTHRSLSDDFLIEAKKAVKSAESGRDTFDLSFMIPKNQRNLEHEILIKRRLREHFRRHSLIIQEEINDVKIRGMSMLIAGVLMILIATYLLSIEIKNYLVYVLIAILEPGGWFTGWTGLDEIYYTTKQKRPDLEFYQKMTRCEISFHPY
ncbi:MAG: hypothetical protein AABX85_03405 [Nanoarchaeota archaeon]